jgi:hypothetical protein
MQFGLTGVTRKVRYAVTLATCTYGRNANEGRWDCFRTWKGFSQCDPSTLEKLHVTKIVILLSPQESTVKDRMHLAVFCYEFAQRTRNAFHFDDRRTIFALAVQQKNRLRNLKYALKFRRILMLA